MSMIRTVGNYLRAKKNKTQELDKWT